MAEMLSSSEARFLSVETISGMWGVPAGAVAKLVMSGRLPSMPLGEPQDVRMRRVPNRFLTEDAHSLATSIPETDFHPLPPERKRKPSVPLAERSPLAVAMLAIINAHPVEEGKYVYFIRSQDFVKIGFSIDPEYRLSVMQTGNPAKMRIMKYVAGSYQTEKAFHRLLKKHRERYEWYRLTPELHAAIRELPSRRKRRV